MSAVERAVPSAAVQLRAMRWWDVPPIESVERRAFPANPWSQAQFWSELAGVPATRHYLVAEQGDQVAGYAGLRVVGREGDVQTLAVAPAWRGRGLGRRLLRALVVEADRRGCHRLMLEVAEESAAARALYEAEGFAPLSRRRDYYGPGQHAMVMRRVLTPEPR